MSNSFRVSSVPKYSKHKASGRAYARFNGRCIYFGRYGTASSREAFERLKTEWQQHGGQLPSAPDETTITEIVIAYTEFATVYYRKNGKPTDEVRMVKAALKVVRALYGRTPAAEFGPLALKACREAMIGKNWCRTHINKQVDRVKRCFKWATENEMVPGYVYEALRCVTGLKLGRSPAREGRKVMPVSDADVLATVEHLPAVVSAMVQLQRLTGARPSEICVIRPGDVNRQVDPWEYVPQTHKTEHHDRRRVLFIGPKAQQVLSPYLLRAPEAYCFSPREAEARRRADRHKARQVPLSCGNRPGTNRKKRPRRTAREKYDRDSYARAVRRAAVKANINRWSPGRLRHTFATEVRRRFGIEAVQVTLGHAHAAISEVYAERDLAKAASVARQIG